MVPSNSTTAQPAWTASPGCLRRRTTRPSTAAVRTAKRSGIASQRPNPVTLTAIVRFSAALTPTRTSGSCSRHPQRPGRGGIPTGRQEREECSRHADVDPAPLTVGWVKRETPVSLVRYANRSRTAIRVIRGSTPRPWVHGARTHHFRGGSLHAPYKYANRSRTAIRVIRGSTPRPWVHGARTHHFRGGSLHAPYKYANRSKQRYALSGVRLRDHGYMVPEPTISAAVRFTHPTSW